MAITFTDKQEAIEYMKRKHDDGYLSILHRINKNKYEVKLVGSVQKLGKSSPGEYKNGKIGLIPDADAITRYHEEGHKFYKHKTGFLKIDELVRYEIEAESYAYKKMNKSINYKVAIPVFFYLIEDFGKTQDDAINIIENELKKKNISISEQNKRNLKTYKGVK